jgi:hypothetical protein
MVPPRFNMSSIQFRDGIAPSPPRPLPDQGQAKSQLVVI